MDWASPDEMFVRIPGIVVIRVSSDDPDFIEPEPVDLFDEQKNGLPDYYGKKDKHSTEQTWFTCIVCDCDLKSVVTLRMHCKGSQHVRKTLQKEKEFRKRKKMEKMEKDGNACDGSASSQGLKRVKREYYEDDDITKAKELAKMEPSRDDQDERSNGHQEAGVTKRVSTLEDDISRLHRRVAKHVTENMNKYFYQDPAVHKIRNLEDFARIAKKLSHYLRAKIKESYEAYNNGSLEGISLTPDHAAFIKTEVQRRFEPLPPLTH